MFLLPPLLLRSIGLTANLSTKHRHLQDERTEPARPSCLENLRFFLALKVPVNCAPSHQISSFVELNSVLRVRQCFIVFISLTFSKFVPVTPGYVRRRTATSGDLHSVPELSPRQGTPNTRRTPSCSKNSSSCGASACQPGFFFLSESSDTESGSTPESCTLIKASFLCTAIVVTCLLQTLCMHLRVSFRAC